MSEHYTGTKRYNHMNGQQPEPEDQKELDRLISQSLRRRAEKIQVDPYFRQRILQNLQPRYRRNKVRQRRYIRLGLAIAACLLLLIGVATLPLWLNRQAPAPVARLYVTGSSLNTPKLLANGGRIISIDPSGQHIIYTPADQPGVMYTANLSNPTGSNHLAMRDARDVDWSPDGTSLVATVQAQGSPLPLLALVSPVGGYMHPLGHYTSTAADWLPGTSGKISFVTQETNKADFWETSPTGSQTKLLNTLPLTSVVQQMAWSPDGKLLALLVTMKNSSGLQPTGEELLVLNERTGQTTELVPPGSGTLSDAHWSPNSKFLTFASQGPKQHVTLVTYDVTQQKALFSLPLQGKLEGWSWSPDSRILVYSDGGKLQAHVLSGKPIRFADNNQQFVSPTWMSDGRILCLEKSGTSGKLIYLIPGKS